MGACSFRLKLEYVVNGMNGIACEAGRPSRSKPAKVGFVLLSPQNEPIPSTRIAVLNILPYLRAAGFVADIIFEPEFPTEAPTLNLDVARLAAEGYQVVCFQKVSGTSVLATIAALRSHGIRTVFVVCDIVDEDMVRATDATIVVTEYLKGLYSAVLQGKMTVIHDGIERGDVQKVAWRDDFGSRARPLRAVLVTSAKLERLPVLRKPPSWLEVVVVGRYQCRNGLWSRLVDAQSTLRQQSGWMARLDAFRFMLSRRIVRRPWHPDGVYDELCGADIGIIPIDVHNTNSRRTLVPHWRVKSENRLTLMMSVGLPVVATPIPAYEPVVEQGQNAILVQSHAQWHSALEALRDPSLRRLVGDAARASVIERYSIRRQSEAVIGVLSCLVDGPLSPSSRYEGP